MNIEELKSKIKDISDELEAISGKISECHAEQKAELDAEYGGVLNGTSFTQLRSFGNFMSAFWGIDALGKAARIISEQADLLNSSVRTW